MLHLESATIIFQVINFLILLGVLSWFFYRPLTGMMRRREEEIQDRLRVTEERAASADAEREKLVAQVAEAKSRTEELLASARAQATEERDQLLEVARRDAQQIRDDALALTQSQARSAALRLEDETRRAAVDTAAALIRAVAGPQMHQSLLAQLSVRDLSFANGGENERIRRAMLDARHRVTVEVACPTEPERIEGLREALCEVLGDNSNSIQMNIQIVPELIAGARLLIGTLVVDLSLRHMLEQLADNRQPSMNGDSDDREPSW